MARELISPHHVDSAAGALPPQGGAKTPCLLVELSMTLSGAGGLGEFPDLPTPADTSVGRVSPVFDLEVPSVVLVGLRSVILRRGLPTPCS